MNENQKEDCPHCKVSDDTIQKLKDSAQISKKTEYDSKKQQKQKEEGVKAQTQKAKKIFFIAASLLVLAGIVFAGFKYIPSGKEGAVKATVFYSPTCSCCKEYITYLRAKGFDVETKQTNDMLSIKEKYNIPSEAESCHTTIVGNYFAEGHMPVQFINKLLDEKPNIDGIALPGMPQGSPGMSGLKLGISEIYAVNNGNLSEFAEW